MAGLTPEVESRLEEFLRPSRIAVVATIGSSGMPQLTPNWYRYSRSLLTISTTEERSKHRNLKRDPRLSVCIYSQPLAENYAVVTGRADVFAGNDIWPDTRAIVERYVEPERVETVLDRMRKQNRVIISLTPEHVIFRY